MADRLNLTGRWDGTYRYADGVGPDTPFVARVSENGVRFLGEIIEPNEFRPEIANATIEGVRAGRAVEFTKSYHGAGPAYETPVEYSGQLSEDGNTIAGTWTLLEFEGFFEMMREQEKEEPETAEVSVTVPRLT